VVGDKGCWHSTATDMDYAFVIADRFTPTPFGGNRLAIFPDGRGLSEERMKDLAPELGFSKTTYVFPPELGAYLAQTPASAS
jgi:trans-2,3-dihydro-3-hydroxyanthranilate isomerase